MEENNNNNQIDEDNKVNQTFGVKFKNYIKNLFDFSQYTVKTIIYIIVFIALIIISLILIYYMLFVDDTFLFRIVVEWFVNPIYSLGFLGILLFIIIMAIQGLLVPIPSEIVLLATGMIWGWFYGGIMAIIGSMAAALLCFYISKKGGRPLAEKFIGKKGIDLVDDLISEHGIKVIIVGRFIPIIPFDVISYTSGLVDIDVKDYAIGTLIGSIFRSFFYSIMGSLLFQQHALTLPLNFSTVPFDVIQNLSNTFNIVLLIIFAVLGVMLIFYYTFTKYLEKKQKISNKKE